MELAPLVKSLKPKLAAVAKSLVGGKQADGLARFARITQSLPADAPAQTANVLAALVVASVRARQAPPTGMRKFEDPLTAFEDPLTAFEDPLTALADPTAPFDNPVYKRMVQALLRAR